MAEVNKETIEKLTQLSRIGCSEEEQEALLRDLQGILAYVEQLQEVDTENVAPCNHVLEGMINVMRDDVADEQIPRKVFLDNSPDQVGGFIRVPTVIKQN